MSPDSLIRRKQAAIAALALVAIAVHLVLRFGATVSTTTENLPLWIALALGGVPLVWDLLIKLVHREFGSDLLVGISIVTSVLLEEYLAGTLVVLMLSGGETLEAYAVRSASSVLEALAKRMPSRAHRKIDSQIADVPLEELAVGDTVLVFPHEVCPIDGTVVEGHGVMDESYLTGEPYMISKTPGSAVLSGAINGESALTIRADKLAVDSRYAKIIEVMQSSQESQPPIRRLGDQLGAYYTPVAVAIGILAWLATGDAVRFLAVMVAATVGIAFGQNSDVTTEAADAVVMDSSLAKVDELLHISNRMRRIALQSAVGGILVSILGMLIAAAGYLPPVAGAIAQEVIDVVVVVNALRVAVRPKELTDF